MAPVPQNPFCVRCRLIFSGVAYEASKWQPRSWTETVSRRPLVFPNSGRRNQFTNARQCGHDCSPYLKSLNATKSAAPSSSSNRQKNLLASSNNIDIIIVGAGVAGSALAYVLGKDGRKVLLLEKNLSPPDSIAGELLQPGGYLKLVELGLDDCLHDIDAQRVFGYALFKDGRDTKVGYPLQGHNNDVSGRSFHNSRFVQRLREKATTIPLVQLQQATVLSLIEVDGIVKGVRCRVSGVGIVEAYAPLTIVCDGCFSNLRHTLCASKPEVSSWFIGVVLANCKLPYANHGHVVLADPSPILFYPISSTEVRCLVDIPGQKLQSTSSKEVIDHLKLVVAPQLPVQLQSPFLDAVNKGKLRGMPNKTMPGAPLLIPGVLLLGDAFNMRHPLTGGGMTVALSDVVLIRNLLHRSNNFYDVSALYHSLQQFYILRKPLASTINTLANALYKVFCASSILAMQELRQACFEYLSMGGIFSSGPVALLSGMNPNPISLVLHFFAVSVYGVGRLLLPFPSPRRIWLVFQLLVGAWNIIFPILQAEGLRQVFFSAQFLKMTYKLK